MKHTKGKWLRANRTDVLYIESDNGERIANVCINLDGKNNPEKIKEGKANANLIATAPEMLSLLKRFLKAPAYEEARNTTNMYMLLEEIKAVTTKAEGK